MKPIGLDLAAPRPESLTQKQPMKQRVMSNAAIPGLERLEPGSHVLVSSASEKSWMAGSSQVKPGHDGKRLSSCWAKLENAGYFLSQTLMSYA